MRKQSIATIALIVEFGSVVDGKYTLTDEARDKAKTILAEGMEAGEIGLSEKSQAKYDTYDKKRSYANSLINNYIKKSPELNEGKKYVPANPKGPRKSDNLKNMELLREEFIADGESDEKIAILDKAIEGEKVVKAKTEVKGDMSVLSDELRKQLGED